MKRDDQNLEPLDAILRRAMRESPGRATPECADSEQLAAYYDRSLLQSERDRLEAHFADCARCQLQLAAIVRADEQAGDARPASALAWLRGWRIAIPALAAVAAVFVAVAVIHPRGDELQRGRLVAMAKHDAPRMDLAARAPAPASPPAAASAPAAPASSELAKNEEAKPVAAPPAREPREEPRNEYRAKPPDRAGAAASDKTAPSYGVAGMESAPAAKTESAETPPTMPRSELQMGAGNPGLRTMQMAQTTNPPAGAGYGAAASAIAGSARSGPAPSSEALVTISPPDRGATWMIGKRGMILTLDANGKTHQRHSGVETDLTAGAASSATVCWIVGRAGTIIRTTDGDNWKKITSPTDADLIAVTADSAQQATITTAGGQNFATSDGGASWHQR